MSGGHSSSHISHGKAITVLPLSCANFFPLSSALEAVWSLDLPSVLTKTFSPVIHSCFWEVVFVTWLLYIANLVVVIGGNALSISSRVITELLAIKLLIRVSLLVNPSLLMLIYLMYSLFQTYTRLGLIREIICIILLVNRLNFSLISKPHLKQILRFSYKRSCLF